MDRSPTDAADNSTSLARQGITQILPKRQLIKMEDYLVTKCGSTCWKYDKMPFSAEIALKAEKELNEKPEERANAIQSFRKVVNEKADFTCRMDDAFLLRFLRARKFNQDRAFKLLRNFYACIKKYPDIFGEVRPSAIKDYLFQYSTTVLPYRDPEGRIIVVLQMSEWNAERTPFCIAIRIIAMIVESMIEDPVNQVNGVVAVLDFRNVSLKPFLRNVVTPSNMYTIFCLLQDCFPGRVKDKHIIFGLSIVQVAYNVAKLFMNAKMRRRIIFHGDKLSSLHQYIPPDILPEELGGSLQVDKSLYAKKLMTYEDVFLDVMNYGFPKS